MKEVFENLALDLSRHAARQPLAPAILLPDRQLSYAELNAAVWRRAQYLHDSGVRAGQLLAVTLADELQLALTLLAVSRLGATFLSIPRSATGHQRTQQAQQAQIGLLLTDAADRFAAGVDCLLVGAEVEAASGDGYDLGIMAAHPAAPWQLVTGSGTTGAPRQFMVTHAQQRARQRMSIASMGITAADRSLHLSHLDFVSAKNRLYTMLAAGGAVFLHGDGGLDPAGLCRRHSITMLDATTFHIERLLAALPSADAAVLGGLRALIMSSSTVSDELRQRIKAALSENLYVVYGTNEIHLISLAVPPEVFTQPGSVGRPVAGVRCEVVTGAGAELPIGEVGLIRARSDCLVAGYRNDDAATRAAFRDGWFYPGDLGKLTLDGQLVYYGRADHMMIFNGINIYPAEIEQVLAAHPAVRDVAAVPLQHRVHQSIPVAAVALHGATQASERALLAYARERLGAHAPHHVLILATIPRNEQGKLIRAAVQKQLQERLDSQPLVGSDSALAVAGQLARPLGFRFRAPDNPQLEQLDAWLASVFELAPVPAVGGDISPGSQAAVEAWLQRVLLLALELLQALGVPAFDEPRILALQRDRESADGWRAGLAFAEVSLLPLAAYQACLRTAARACAWAADHPVSDAHRATLFAVIETQLLQPLRGVLPVGKSTLPVLRAAYLAGIPFIHLGAGVFQLGWGSGSRRLERSTTDRDSAIGLRLSHSKVATAGLLAQAGLPVPRHEVVPSLERAREVARSLGWPVVVKPLDRDRGEGVTVGVANDQALEAAWSTAQAASAQQNVLIEREVEGVCHRLFIAAGELLYAVKRLPASVVGDGRQTVAQLVAQSAAQQQALPPWRRSPAAAVDAAVVAELARQGLAPDSLPEAGALVPLRRIESTEWGGVDEDVTALVHPENLRIALAAARQLGLEVAGVDLICGDITLPWYQTGAVINEVNFAPLLGGGEISRQQLPAFLQSLLPGGGRIPVEVYIGGEAALAAARLRWRDLCAAGLGAALTSDTFTEVAEEGERILPFASLNRRLRALVLDCGIDALVAVVQTDEFLHAGLPLEAMSAVTWVDSHLLTFDQRLPVSARRLQTLRALLPATLPPSAL